MQAFKAKSVQLLAHPFEIGLVDKLEFVSGDRGMFVLQIRVIGSGW
jgi:hypothetical protein